MRLVQPSFYTISGLRNMWRTRRSLFSLFFSTAFSTNEALCKFVGKFVPTVVIFNFLKQTKWLLPLGDVNFDRIYYQPGILFRYIYGTTGQIISARIVVFYFLLQFKNKFPFSTDSKKISFFHHDDLLSLINLYFAEKWFQVKMS